MWVGFQDDGRGQIKVKSVRAELKDEAELA